MINKATYKLVKIKSIVILCSLLSFAITSKAQVGDYRNALSLGASGGATISSIGFTPNVPQSPYLGYTYGFVARYKSERYMNMICSLQLEVNYTQSGWKQLIQTDDEQPVMTRDNPDVAEEYERRQNYVQIPFLAHLAFGKEEKGFNFYLDAGPMVGIFLDESTNSTYETGRANYWQRSSPVIKQETMPTENNIDYGITAGLGIEYSYPKLGHLQLSARYYLGLGNIYGNSKQDYFAKSNHGDFVVKMAYLVDIFK